MTNYVTDNERSLLGSMVVDPTVVDRVTEHVCGADFRDPDLGRFFDCLVDAHMAGRPINDAVVLVGELRRYGVVASLTSAASIAGLFDRGVASHAVFYAQAVRSAARLRRLRGVADQLRERTGDPAADPESISAWLEAEIMAGASVPDDIRTVGEFAQSFAEKIVQPEDRRRVVFCGIPSVDERVGGWLPGELVVLAARTSVGKTAFASQMAMHVARQGQSVLFVSIEMDGEQLSGRTAAGKAGVNSRMIRNNQCTEDDIAQIMFQVSRLEGLPVHIWGAAAPTTARIRANARRVQAAHGLDLLVVDYLGLVRPDDPRVIRTEQIGQIMRDLKDIAKQLSVPVLVLAQLNRQADDSLPKLSHLRESGNIEQDADAVLFLHAGDGIASRTRELIVAKHRYADPGSNLLMWDAVRQEFSGFDVQPQPLEEFV